MKFSVAFLTTILASSSVGMGGTVPELVRRQTPCAPGSTIPNPAVLQVSAGATVSVAAQSNAGNLQQLTVSPGSGGISNPTPVIFQGTGEDVPIPVISGGTGNGFTIPPQSSAVPIVRCPLSVDVSKIVINAVTSEDSIDNDDNDTIAIVVFS
ncbi:hypothetical protein CPC08DRAFT_708952 [Agrocybe pediades]|nr:hypothetical protein CPC08DRAFT_708952 [Agrocybe pediades]